MRKILIVLVLLAAGATLAKDVEFEFNPSATARTGFIVSNARAWLERGSMTLSAGDQSIPVAAYTAVSSDADLRRAVAVQTTGMPVQERLTYLGSIATGEHERIQCFLTSY